MNNKQSFSFQYCIDLGRGRFGSILVDEKSDLYRQAENFCRTHDLDSSIALILENQMFNEILLLKDRQHQESTSPYTRSPQHRTTAPSPLERLRSVSRGSNNASNAVSKERKKLAAKHCEDLYRRHQAIQEKKQLERQSSLQKIPFRPIINKLSKKIIETKRRLSKSRFLEAKQNQPTTRINRNFKSKNQRSSRKELNAHESKRNIPSLIRKDK